MSQENRWGNAIIKIRNYSSLAASPSLRPAQPNPYKKNKKKRHEHFYNSSLIPSLLTSPAPPNNPLDNPHLNNNPLLPANLNYLVC